nr:MAG TPA: hypothetical protein [Caudoviricetes sp.]
MCHYAHLTPFLYKTRIPLFSAGFRRILFFLR